MEEIEKMSPEKSFRSFSLSPKKASEIKVQEQPSTFTQVTKSTSLAPALNIVPEQDVSEMI